MIVLLILVAVFSAINPIYLSLYNLIDIIEQATINGLLAIGITFCDHPAALICPLVPQWPL